MQPIGRTVAALHGRGLLLVVPSECRADTAELVVAAGLQAQLWDNGTPFVEAQETAHQVRERPFRLVLTGEILPTLLDPCDQTLAGHRLRDSVHADRPPRLDQVDMDPR